MKEIKGKKKKGLEEWQKEAKPHDIVLECDTFITHEAPVYICLSIIHNYL